MSIFTGEYFDNYRLQDLSREIIEAAEMKLKVKLPISYIELMNEQNGGELRLKKFINEQLEDGHLVINYLNGIGTRNGEGIFIDSYIKREWGLSNKFIYLNGDSHTWIALDYRRYTGDNPPIVYIDLDTNEKIKIANNFSDFVSCLTVLEGNEENEYSPGDDLSIFTREEVEKEIIKGNKIYVMTAGLEYFGFIDENLNWFLDQLLISVKQIVNNKKIDAFSTVDYYLDIIIQIIKKRKINFNEYSQTKELLGIITNYPDILDDKGIIKNKGIKIQSFLLQ